MQLIFQSPPPVTIASNTFINVPVILKYEEVALIELVQLVREQAIEFTTRIPIYHPDGTYLAVVKGNRVYPTEEGKKAKVTVRDEHGKFTCCLDNKQILELTHGVGDAFKAQAELYTPDGYSIKCTDAPKPDLFDLTGNAIKVAGVTIIGNVFRNLSVGIWLRKDGSCSVGVR